MPDWDIQYIPAIPRQLSFFPHVETFMCTVKAEAGYQSGRLFLPQTAGGVAQQQGGLEPDPVVVPLWDAAPARVRDDHRVGQRGQRVTDDGHLHSVTWRQVPEDAWGGGATD